MTEISRNAPCPCGSAKKYCLGTESPNDRFQESPAHRISQEIFTEVHKEAAANPFASLDELNAFLKNKTLNVNQRTIPEFLGLSPDQMQESPQSRSQRNFSQRAASKTRKPTVSEQGWPNRPPRSEQKADEVFAMRICSDKVAIPSGVEPPTFSSGGLTPSEEVSAEHADNSTLSSKDPINSDLNDSKEPADDDK